ncbi:hypothetical protein L3X38_002841 [Prunus dulcis]|uniref:Uncharacterized protein n=1 Tax=Prunus dulcis TaxID=3755 RepID=A0AAD4WUU1_PRUDU|nr:hypothetical protein L3X38_002841 [Prunus dulcis]
MFLSSTELSLKKKVDWVGAGEVELTQSQPHCFLLFGLNPSRSASSSSSFLSEALGTPENSEHWKWLSVTKLGAS